MTIDIHIHTKGGEDGNKILKAMDHVGLKRAVLMSRPPHWSLASDRPETVPHRTAIDDVARIVAPDRERLIGFAWIEPSLPDAAEMVDYALGEKRLKGIKMLPHHWYPDDARAQACYARINEYGAPMLFHSGILFTQGNTSPYCRPAGYEIMLEYPRIRFALAHMSWPWTDECFAVCGKFRALEQAENWRSFADITGSGWRIWKGEALRKGLAYLGDSQFVYGSDCADPENPEALRGDLRTDRELLRECGCTEENLEKIFTQNAERWLGLAG